MVHIHAESKNFNASGDFANDIQVKSSVHHLLMYSWYQYFTHLLVLEQVESEVKVEEITGNMALPVSSVLEIDL